MLGTIIYCGAFITTLASIAWAYVWLGQDNHGDTGHDHADHHAGHDHVDHHAGHQQKGETANEDMEDVSSDPCVFDISPLDECEFVPLVSPEEDARIAAELAPKTQYIPLDEDNPAAHINAYLDMVHDDDDDDYEDGDHAVDSEVLKKAKNFTTDDVSKYISPKDLNILDDPRESPSRRGTVMSRVKKARQRAIRNAVERNMTADDRMKEQMAANQMLAKVYTIMRENKEVFGDTSFNDVKNQMEMYKA